MSEISNVSASKNYKTYEVNNENAKSKEAAAAEKSAENNQKKETSGAVYEKGNTEVYDKATVQQTIKAVEQSKVDSFRKLIASMIKSQTSKSYQAKGGKGKLKDYFANLKVDPETSRIAQQEISEDGYWGVKQTSQRILDFAVGIAGDDQEKLAEMRAAVEKGFKQARDMWGGELPGICGQTYDAVMAGFDKLQNKNEVDY